jgi:hypothetical protein
MKRLTDATKGQPVSIFNQKDDIIGNVTGQGFQEQSRASYSPGRSTRDRPLSLNMPSKDSVQEGGRSEDSASAVTASPTEVGSDSLYTNLANAELDRGLSLGGGGQYREERTGSSSVLDHPPTSRDPSLPLLPT